MSVSIVARRYANALLELGLEEGDLETLVRDLGALAEAWNASTELRNAVENPQVALAAKKAAVVQVASALAVGATARNAALLLVDRRRAQALPYVATTLRELADVRKGVVRAQVSTAAPLSEAYYARLQAQLERLTGMRVVVERHTDPSLIGGVVTRIGDRIFDGSVRSRLDSMREALMPIG